MLTEGSLPQVVGDPARITQLRSNLVAHGLIERGEARLLARNEAAFQDMRIRLHYVAGRREDRIVFDFQNALAAQFGDLDTPERRASEAMMQRYYRAAKTVTQLNTIVLQNIGARLFPEEAEARALNERFSIKSELLQVIDEKLFEREPSAILEFALREYAPEVAISRTSVACPAVRVMPAIMPAMAPSRFMRLEKTPRSRTGKKEEAARPKAKATTSATKPGGLMPK